VLVVVFVVVSVVEVVDVVVVVVEVVETPAYMHSWNLHTNSNRLSGSFSKIGRNPSSICVYLAEHADL
jgi:hypothetical protein